VPWVTLRRAKWQTDAVEPDCSETFRSTAKGRGAIYAATNTSWVQCIGPGHCRADMSLVEAGCHGPMGSAPQLLWGTNHCHGVSPKGGEPNYHMKLFDHLL
jgi:hypothetical protein